MSKKCKIHRFKNRAEELEFWHTHDPIGYYNSTIFVSLTEGAQYCHVDPRILFPWEEANE